VREMTRLSFIVVVISAIAAGCSIFDTREPEDPLTGAGTWLQPDTPDRVVQNIQNSIAEMNSRNYLRSLGPDFAFDPTVSAKAREPSLWTGWAIPDEETYFGRLVASSNFLSGHSLQLLDVTENVVDDQRYVMDANYILTVQHGRAAEDVPTQLQGHLIWAIQRSSEGLWYLQAWTDQEIQNEPSWSELKSTFVK
jgi:hypothetical protein